MGSERVQDLVNPNGPDLLGVGGFLHEHLCMQVIMVRLHEYSYITSDFQYIHVLVCGLRRQMCLLNIKVVDFLGNDPDILISLPVIRGERSHLVELLTHILLCLTL